MNMLQRIPRVKPRAALLCLSVLLCAVSFLLLPIASALATGGTPPLATVTPAPEEPLPAVVRSSETLQAQEVAHGWRPIGPYGGHVREICAAAGKLYVLAGPEPSLVWVRQAERWQPTGLYAQRIACAPGGAVLASRHGALYRSADGGATWVRVHQSDGSITTISFDVADGSWALAAGQRLVDGEWKGFVLASRDGGNTWAEAPGPRLYKIVAGGGRAYAISWEWDALMLSSDGLSWVQAQLPEPNPADVTISQEGERVFAAAGGRLFVSEDAGSSWQEIARNTARGNAYMRRLLLAAGGDLFAIGGFWSQVDGVWEWQESLLRLAEGRWQELPMPAPAESLTGLAVADGALWAASATHGVLRSADRGATWQEGNLGLRAIVYAELVPHGGELYLATPSGLYAGLPESDTWRRITTPLDGEQLVSAASDGQSLYIASRCALARLEPSGQWQLVLPGTPCQDIARLRIGNGALYLLRGSKDLLRSSDGGKTWPALPPLPEGASARDIAVHGGQLYLGTDKGLYRWVNSSWQELPSLPEKGVTALLSAEGLLWAATEASPSYSGRGLFLSADGGASWSAADYGITARVRYLTAGGAGRVYAGTDDGVFFTASAGRRWRALDAGMPQAPYTSYARLTDGVVVSRLVVLPGDEGDTLVAATNRGLLWLPGTPAQLVQPYTSYLPLVQGASAPRAVLIVGPVDPPEHRDTMSFIRWADEEAQLLEKAGLQVTKLYLQEATWPNVRRAIQGASVVIYKGHGFGFGEIPADTTEMGGGLHGFCLYNPDEPEGAQLATQDMLIATTDLAPGGLAFIFACYSGGSSDSDTEAVPQALAARRIEGYAYTFLAIGARAYFGGCGSNEVMERWLEQPGLTALDVYCGLYGCSDAFSLVPALFPGYAGRFKAFYDGSGRLASWGHALVADPGFSLAELLQGRP